MPTQYLKRTLEPLLQQVIKEFPVVVLSGPRQAGKTTLFRHLLTPKYRYVSLEPPDVRAAANADPRGFLDLYPPPVIFDEVQYAPDLLPYIKERVDAERDRRGMYLLSGSQNLLLLESVTESLAGRAVILRLLPLSWREQIKDPLASLPWDDRPTVKRQSRNYLEIWRLFLRGSYPELTQDPARDANRWHAAYIQTYLERDVRSLRQVGDLTQFQNFLRALAARSAQMINLTDLARDLGLAVNTVKAWISILEASYQIIIIRPYFANLGKRLVKTPKIYFTDVGTLSYLVGLRDPEHAAKGPMAGAIMETAVVAEIYKRLCHSGIEPRLYFWRTAAGSEVDLLVEVATRLIPIEIKATATPLPSMASGIKALRADLGDKVADGFLIHLGEQRLPLGGGVTALPWWEL